MKKFIVCLCLALGTVSILKGSEEGAKKCPPSIKKEREIARQKARNERKNNRPYQMPPRRLDFEEENLHNNVLPGVALRLKCFWATELKKEEIVAPKMGAVAMGQAQEIVEIPNDVIDFLKEKEEEREKEKLAHQLDNLKI